MLIFYTIARVISGFNGRSFRRTYRVYIPPRAYASTPRPRCISDEMCTLENNSLNISAREAAPAIAARISLRQTLKEVNVLCPGISESFNPDL